MRDLTTSFSALEEKVLEQYTFAKVSHIVIPSDSILYVTIFNVEHSMMPKAMFDRSIICGDKGATLIPCKSGDKSYPI